MNYYEIEVHSARHNRELAAEAQAMIEGQRLRGRAGRRQERPAEGEGPSRHRHFPSPFRHSHA
jgi:hypothetical protein